MSKIELRYIGQERAARRYLMGLEKYGVEKVASMLDSEVESAINKHVEEKDMEIVFREGGQDIGLVPIEILDQIRWFSR